MKGDLVNVLSFAAVVPGYYYLAIRNHYKPRNFRITYGNEHDVDNGGPAAIEGKPFPSLLSSESSSRCMEDIYDTEHPRCNDNHQDDHMLRLQSELSENEQKTLKRQTIVPFLAEISTSCSNVDVCTEDDKANINCNIRSTPILSVTQQSEVFEEPVQQQANIEEASVSQQFLICFLFTVTILSGGLSWYYRIIYLSAVSFVFSMAAAASMNIYQWPHPNEKIMIPQFLWHLLVLCGNNKLPLVYQISLSLYALCYASFVVTHPPYTLKDTFPILFGSTALHIAFQISMKIDKSKTFSLRNDTFRSVFASLLLTTMFAYHVFNEILNMFLQPNYAVTGGFSILRAGFFASFGLFAAGAFKNESDAKDLLEILVRKRTQLIQQQARRLRMVEMALEASETAIAITDHSLRIVWCNPAFERLTNMTDKALLYNTDIMSTLKTSKSDYDRMKRCFDDQSSMEEEVTVNGATIHMQVGPFIDDDINSNMSNGSDGSSFVPETTLYSDSSSDEGTAGGSRFIVILKDFTEKRKREMAEKAAERETLLKQAMSESCQILSHELRTPLQGIMGMTSMLLDANELTKEAEDAMSLVMVSSRLLLTLINNMLDVRKCDANMMSEFELVPTELSPPIEDAVNFCRPLGAMSNVRIDLIPSNMKDIVVLSDPLRLQQVVINLVSNSIKHSSSGCTINIRTSISTLERAEIEISNSLQSGSCQVAWDEEYKNCKNRMKVAIVSVSDTGSGLDVSQAGRLFQKFSQLNDHCSGAIGGNQVGQPSGTGLGLNLCLKFIHRMKGNIWAANNRNGQGATFAFYIPLLSVSESHQENGISTAEPTRVLSAVDSSTSSSVASRCRVLVVDDTLINLKVLDRMLKKVGVGFVRCVDSGGKALAALENDNYNLVITDIQMPGMSGTELSEEIVNRRVEFKNPAIVGLTAEVSKEMDEQCAKSGMLKVLHKPVTAHQLKDFFDHVVPQIVDMY